jgi:hypothetical protein
MAKQYRPDLSRLSRDFGSSFLVRWAGATPDQQFPLLLYEYEVEANLK